MFWYTFSASAFSLRGVNPFRELSTSGILNYHNKQPLPLIVVSSSSLLCYLRRLADTTAPSLHILRTVIKTYQQAMASRYRLMTQSQNVPSISRRIPVSASLHREVRSRLITQVNKSRKTFVTICLAHSISGVVIFHFPFSLFLFCCKTLSSIFCYLLGRSAFVGMWIVTILFSVVYCYY